MHEAGVSPRSIARAVNRRGKRWKLHALVKPDGRVVVCDTLYEAEVRSGVGVVRKVERELRTVDEDAPFSGALAARVDNGETNLGRRFDRYADMIRARRQAAIERYDEETRRQWRERRRASFLPGGIFVPSGLAERFRHRRRT